MLHFIFRVFVVFNIGFRADDTIGVGESDPAASVDL